jgi:hypothetical protein
MFILTALSLFHTDLQYHRKNEIAGTCKRHPLGPSVLHGLAHLALEKFDLEAIDTSNELTMYLTAIRVFSPQLDR